MGALILGDPREKRRYSIAEISQATGIKAATLQRRRAKLGIPADGVGYSYEQILQIIKKPTMKKVPSAEAVARLRAQLKTDGMI